MIKKISSVLIVLAVVGVGLYLAHPLILPGLADFLIVKDQIEKADMIIVLAGDYNGERVRQAAQLYNRGYAPVILMSGGPVAWKLTYAANMKYEAIALGVPAKAILLQDKSLSTIEDARFSLPIVQEKKAFSVIVVTSPQHSRRAARVFRKIFEPEKIKVMLYPVGNSSFNPDKWWTKHEESSAILWEYGSLVFYFMKGY
ncbi:MAG: YdcF family protein [Candidatus Margulisbacteria bacterium]|nr:YdcF family protein [Candidatus Margulisiibacteriota bacterium]MBU1616651.1 YdcF family protein [Candidatus Margulisiibacteriota bacterium]MBU1867780.1 YdcF family protein [Candidatus Margulisiibacteriota bacterium]